MFTKKSNSIFFIWMISALSFKLYAQSNGDFNVGNNLFLQEKIFAHTDKNFYLAGEIIWFKLYNVSADSLKPLDLSKLAYVEILNAQQKPVLQATVALSNGSGNGSFYLTSSLATGNYIFRAYTNWMKNFGADVFFQKTITVINTLTKAPKSAGKNQQEFEAGFYPEGGNFVAGIESKVGFKVTDAFGKGVNCNGNIVDENNNIITSFSALKFGMGYFYFKPEQNHTYKAVVKINNNNIEKNLAVIDKGYVMHAAIGKETISVAVHSNENMQRPVYLIAYSNNKAKTTLMQQTGNDGDALFIIQKNNLPAGITHLVLFNGNRTPVCERMIFIKPQTMHLNVNADNSSYTKRSEVKLNIDADAAADLSLAVYMVDSLQPENDDNILSRFWLTSELNGNIESPQYYFNENNPEADSAMENLLLTQGWSKFKNDGDVQSENASIQFAPEYEGHIVEGKVFDKTSGMPAANVRVYASVPGQHYRFSNAVSNKDGKVFFDIKDFYGSGELVVQTAKEDSMYRVEIADPYSSQVSNFKMQSLSLSEDKLKALESRNIAMQVQNAYTINQLNKFNSPSLDSNAFYGAPDFKYYLDNYVRFSTMEEVLREYVAGIDVRIKQGNYSLTTTDPRNHTFFEANPLVLIDGVPVFDMNKVIAYSPLKVKKAEVVTRKYYVNSLVADGILSYSTYKGDLDGFTLDPGVIELSYDGLQLQREFYSPQYTNNDAKQTRVPDYRSMLYWSADLAGKKQLSFYTSDIKGKYIAVLQGIDVNGKAAYASTSFEVK